MKLTERIVDSTTGLKMKSGSIVEIHIIDNGKGIKGDLTQIFEPFYTTKTKGTGLGLAVCKNIIVRHGGAISAHDQQEGGTEIVFTLTVSIK